MLVEMIRNAMERKEKKGALMKISFAYRHNMNTHTNTTPNGR